MKLTFLLLAAAAGFAADIRVGIIGTDTSHVPAFTKLLNGDPAAPDHIVGVRVVAAYKGGPPFAERLPAKDVHTPGASWAMVFTLLRSS